MAISAYPRVAVEGTTAANNPPNGQSLMLYNSTTQQYEPATAATFSGGGGGGGDATAANQGTQITEAQQANLLLSNLFGTTEAVNNNLRYDGLGNAEWTNMNYNVLRDILNKLIDIQGVITNGSARVVIQDTGGNPVNVSSNRLNVDTGA